jgi:hypothetical protein
MEAQFSRHIMSACSDLVIVRQGYLEREHGFDRTHWWLMEADAQAIAKKESAG